jgi:uncharacterized RDD family membrane protein YckC
MTEADPYAPPRAAVADPAPAEVHPRASRGRRFVAKLADGVLLLVMAWCGVYVAGTRGVLFDNPAWNLGALIGMAPVAVVQLVLLVRSGQTLAKMAFGLRILGLDGEPVDPWRLVLLRSVVPVVIGYVPIVNVLFGLADALLIFGPERRCIHDHLAGTMVVDLRVRRPEMLRMGIGRA